LFSYYENLQHHVGPTSASINDAVSAIAGAVVGIGIGSAVTALVAHGERIRQERSGRAAGAGGFLLAAIVVLIIGALYSDPLAALALIAFVVIPAGVFALVGAALGASPRSSG
jgi:hypothetical protein